MSAYGEDREEKPDPEQKVLAEFNFDEEDSGFESKYARATGAAYELADSYSEESGKALYLNGKEDNFLTVTDKEGKSPVSYTHLDVYKRQILYTSQIVGRFY